MAQVGPLSDGPPQAGDFVWFKSKVDWPLGLILLVVPLIELTVLVGAVRSGDRVGITAGLTGCAIVAAIYVGLVLPVRYGVATNELLVRFGLVRQHIRYDSILEVRPTHSPLSSPALSFDRLAVRTGRGPLNLTLISPDERQEFLNLLASRARLVWEGDALVRR